MIILLKCIGLSKIGQILILIIDVFLICRFGDEISITNNKESYEPGDIVTWDLKGSSPWHIGIITHHKSYITGNPLVVHNIGSGPIISDMLFKFPITGHYRYVPENYNK